ncbi:MAG: ATP-binding protein [Thermoplasmata archaeon]|nr:ATP-binding protein [Thermoplasmata archaeon]
METSGAVILRALAGLSEGCGRTIVIAGPPESGKSELLTLLRDRFAEAGTRIIEVAGSYRERTVSSAVSARILSEYERVAASEPSASSDSDSREVTPWAMSYAPLVPLASSSVSRHHAAGRGLESVPVDAFWARFTEDQRASTRPALAVVVDDGSLVDTESREFLSGLSGRTRFGPLLLLIALDSSNPAHSLWEEAFTGHPEVDWIRTVHTPTDLRDTQRVRNLLKGLPPASTALVRYTALLGGSASQVTLGRIGRMGLTQVAEALVAPAEAGLLRTRGDRVALIGEAGPRMILGTVTEEERRELHGRVSDALLALHPEPTLEQRLEISEHIAERDKGPTTVRFLAEVAQELERLQRYDLAELHISRAIACASGLASDARILLEAPLRVARTRVLVFAGRLAEAERELRESIGLAVLAQLPAEQLEELAESLFPALRVAGPRPALVTELTELADRLHQREAYAAEMYLLAALTEAHLARTRSDKAREEGARVSRLARLVPGTPVQALALLTVAAPLLEGTEDERRIATKCLRSARAILAASRRPVLQLYADEVHARRLLLRGERAAALTLHERAAPVGQRAHLPALELFHQLGIASTLIEGPADPRTAKALHASRQLAEQLHLIPPSPALLRLALVEGIGFTHADNASEARLRWGFVADLSATVPVPYRAEAWLRLADLELREGNHERAHAYLERLEQPATLRELRLDWAPWLAELRTRVDRELGQAESS